jgi:hypothetical protein
MFLKRIRLRRRVCPKRMTAILTGLERPESGATSWAEGAESYKENVINNRQSSCRGITWLSEH